MTFSNEWGKLYQTGRHLSVWPWSDLVSLVMRHAKPSRKDYCVLELGCGAGANIPFFLNLGVDYYSIEGSPSIVETLLSTYPQLRGKLVVGDFTHELPFPCKFDLIVDRGSLTHNRTAGIESALELVSKQLDRGGRFIGIDWFSTEHSEYANGKATDDVYVRCGYTEGPLREIGIVHFADRKHLGELFANFSVVLLEHHVETRVVPSDGWRRAAWNFVMEKK